MVIVSVTKHATKKKLKLKQIDDQQSIFSVNS